MSYKKLSSRPVKLFLGIPIPIIILIALFVHDSHNNQESTPWQLATIEKTASVPCQISTETGALERYPYGFASRFEDDRRGTNPEEILTAAHAACFTMAFCFACDKVGLPLMQHLVDTHPGRLRLVFRHFPLMEVHPNAELAAEAAEAAAAQGRFWPMHHLLFAQPPGFFLNGQAVDVSFGFEKLEEAVQAALKAA